MAICDAWFASVLRFTASVGLGTRCGAPIVPFGPVPVPQSTIVIQIAPELRATRGQTEGIDPFKTIFGQRVGGAPCHRNRAVQIVGERLFRS